ncbi:DUF1772 domain-containing protein [Amycolatopsis ultiminotia]|uniref:DUF1772 domain-containing protein n=1 Tax=Amycolatopsis ultiminotia TaxID=543629 RepID=A0ABP6YFT0_9PSEU
MTEAVLGVVLLLGSGLTAGVLFAVALSVVPALWVMPAERYVYTHQLIGRHWDPVMPITVLSTTAVAIALAVLTPTAASGWYIAGAVLLLCVSVVSHFCNVPLNRTVKTLDPTRIPDGWKDPRPVWRRWHLLRTALSILALLVNTIAALCT